MKNECIVLCRGRHGRGCCPTMTEVSKRTFDIRDDFGGKITLTNEQIEMMYNHIAKKVN